MNIKARLILKQGNADKELFYIDKEEITIGSYPNNDIVITRDSFISGLHGTIIISDGKLIFKDNKSTNGSFVNGRKVSHTIPLSSGDLLNLGDTVFEVAIDSAVTKKLHENIIKISKTIKIGRDPDCDIFLDDVQVSACHATVISLDSDIIIEDNNSTNGVILNGKKVKRAELKKGDIIQICKFNLYFDGENIKFFTEEGKIRLDAIGLSRIIADGKSILQNISFSVKPCEFVAIVGTSGAGKSTLIKALCGVIPPDSGDVFINGSDFYDNIESFRFQLGYVPQDDIVHNQLTVYKALYYAASLRLPEDIPQKEIDALIEQVLEELEMKDRKHTQIGKLSGGQRKRVSIGVELLTRPSLFFLDEPTSGLDPATEKKMMALLRKLADQGRTVLLVTHVTKNMAFCDKVLFLAKGGYLVFFGSPEDALDYFEVSDFAEIYNKIETLKSPFQWSEDFRNSSYYRKVISDRLKDIEVFRDKNHKPQSLVSSRSRGASSVRQFFILSSRYFEIMQKDLRNLAIIMFQAPIIAILLALVFDRDIFDPDPKIGDGNSALIILFFLICVSVWFGTSNAAREIIKEKAIYERERMINLQIIPYVMSKFVILSLICGIQCAILFGIVSLGIKFPDRGDSLFYVDFYCCLFLTALSGAGMGLLISSIVSTVDKATSIVPILLIPQLIYSGAIIPFEDMDRVSNFIANFAVSKWSLGLLGALVNINDILPEHMMDLYEETFDINIRLYFNILSVLYIIFIILTCLFQKRKDAR